MTRRSSLTTAGALLLAAGLFFAWRMVNDVGPLPSPATGEWRADDAEPGHFHMDGGDAPPTFNEMIRKADAVGMVRMDSADTEEIKRQKASELAYTGFHFTVVQPVAGDLRGGAQVVIWRSGRRVDIEDFYPRPKLGEMFLIFLKHSYDRGGYYPAYGKYGTYQVLGGVLHDVSHHGTATTCEGKPVDSVVAQLKTLSGVK